MANRATGLLLCLLVTVAGCSRRSSAPPIGGVAVRSVGPSSIESAAGARLVLLMSLQIEGIAPAGRVESLTVRAEFARSSPRPLRELLVAVDVDGDGRYEPEQDTVLANLSFDDAGTTADGEFRRTIAVGNIETWLFVGNIRPAALGSTFRLGLGPLDLGVRAANGATLRASAPAAIDGPTVRVATAVFATSGAYTGGGLHGAVRLPPGMRPAMIRVGANPVTGLSLEGPGVYSFLLPPTPAGSATLRVLGAGGELLSEIVDIFRSNHGSGPAKFADVSLQRLPQDHAFSQDAEVADVDGDGDPDLIVPAYSQQTDRLYLNDGSGRFTDVSATHMPDVRADTVHIEPADVDGDGDVDLILGVEGGQNRLYINDGDGRFRDVTDAAGRMPRDGDFTEDLRAGDIDGDGDLDFITANLVDAKDTRRGGQIRVYVNDGAGFFTDETTRRLPLLATRTYDVNLGDLDGDGDLDFFATGYGESDRIYTNDGRGVFDETTDALPPNLQFHTCAALGDLDGDGDLDIVVGSFLGKSRILLNRGGMAFVDGSAGLPLDEMSTYDVALADLDGDRNLDVIFANTGNPSVIVLGDGRARFRTLAKDDFLTPDDNAYDVQVLDADGDGALDLFITAWGDRQDTLYLSRSRVPSATESRVVRIEPSYGPLDGGTWITMRGRGLGAGLTGTLAGEPLTEVTKLDERSVRARVPMGVAGPADLEVQFPGRTSARYVGVYSYETPPAGALRDATAKILGSEPDSSTAVAAGDLTGDGLPDLVFADQTVGARVRVNTGRGLMKRVPFTARNLSTNAVELVDLDGDGKLDMLLVDAGGPAWLFPGAGDGTFGKGVRLPGPALGAEDVAVGDIDKDGDLDLVFAVSGPEVVLRNDGKLGFVAIKQTSTITDVSKGITLGDFNGDGKLDFVVANFMQRTRLFLGDAKGRFTEAVNALPDNTGDQSFGVAVADVDGDGDLDIAVANGGAQVNRLFLNGGRGTFKGAPTGVFRAALGGGAHVIFGDVDGNGTPDLFSAHFWGNNHLYFSNSGRLAERQGMLPNSPGGFAGAVFVDLDDDKDLDLVLAAFWGGSRVLLNPRN